MRKIRYISLLAFCFTLMLVNVQGQGQAPVCASLTAGNLTYAQDFDTLANTGTSSTVPAGFGFAEAGTGANTTYAAGTGSGNGGDTYSFGGGVVAASTERAFGGLQSGSLNPTIGACFTNNTGATVTQFSVRYDGEQWRLGAADRVDRLDFQYSTNATSLTTGTWTDVDALDFTAPIVGPTVGLLDGNAVANRTAGIANDVTGLTIANGATFYIRFNDFNATGADDGLAVDNFSLTVTAPSAAPGTVAGRVINAKGRGLSRVTVMITGGGLGEPLYATTNSFGNYQFEDIPLGSDYVLQVFSRRYMFEQTSMIVNLSDSITDADFIGSELR
jgi:hypothetical protein